LAKDGSQKTSACVCGAVAHIDSDTSPHRRVRSVKSSMHGKVPCMASLFLWLEALAGLKALYDLTQGAVDYADRYHAHIRERDTLAEARRISVDFSTFSDKEVQAIIRRIAGCRDRFIAQGGGEDRARCLCSIFRKISDGNGGVLPRVDDWQNMFRQLNCGVD